MEGEVERTLQEKESREIGAGDALIVVDVQNDFLPGGGLAVPGGDEVIPALNRYSGLFQEKGLPVYTTRDWHPPNHVSFKDQGGPWPVHCVQETEGAQFASDLLLPPSTAVVSKDTQVNTDTYSGFQGADLDERLRAAGLGRLFIGGLATDYCVLNTIKDDLKLGYKVFFLRDASGAVNVNPGDGERAEEEIKGLGAVPVTFEMML